MTGPSRVLTRAAATVGVLALCLAGFLPGAAAGQESPAGQDRLTVTRPGGGSETLQLSRHAGFPALAWETLMVLGWTVEEPAYRGTAYTAVLDESASLALHPGLPFVQVNGDWAQLVHAPYTRGDSLFVPLQLFTDVLPDQLPDRYRADASRSLAVLGGEAGVGMVGTGAAGSQGSDRDADMAPKPAPPTDPTRVVVIDAGHGGRDPGALGPGRSREKDVTLAVAVALARVLESEPDIEVHLTRDDDTLIPLWERGEIATRLKGDRYGVFLSIHANSVTRRDIRGVETYFLSEARTEHEARVAALENSAVELERDGVGGPAGDELGAIISELLNLDFQHWSSELAALTQVELARMHPGPDRGVKQGPMAVLTNAMMPSVLVEVGFITNPDEEALLSREAFHQEVARALARAVLDFFQRYPPGQPRRADGA